MIVEKETLDGFLQYVEVEFIPKQQSQHCDFKVYIKTKIKSFPFFLSQSYGHPFALPWTLILI